MDTEFLHRLESRLTRAKADRQAIIDGAKRQQRDVLTDHDDAEFRSLTDTIKGLDEHITEIREEIERSGRGRGGYLETTALGCSGAPSEDMGRRFAHDVATALHKLSGETRGLQRHARDPVDSLTMRP